MLSEGKMSESLIELVQDKLKEEAWTRAAIGNVTQNAIMDLSKIVDDAFAQDCATQVRELCDEHLAHSKDSISALYISGMIALRQGAIDNSALIALVDIFSKNKKEQGIVDICKTILADDENNKFALRTLANCYREAKNEEMWALYEKLVKIDLEEADMVKALAEHAEELENPEDAVNFYKEALAR